MVYKNTIEAVLDYIDENMKETMNTDLLAEISGYSAPHFFRLFLSYMDMSPMNYVLRRKLYFAARELISCDTKIVDIAYSFGFESHDVFSRAFKRYYGISPGTFRKNGSKLYDFYQENSYCISDYAIPVSLNNSVKDNNNMPEQMRHDVKIVTLPEIKLIGIEREIGIEVASLDHIPDGAVGKVLPSQMYAMIGYEGNIDYKDITDYLYRIWFEENVYKTGHLADFPYCTIEYYAPNDDCDVYNERIYIPIQQMEYQVEKIPSYSGVYFRAINESGSEVKEEAFSVMLKWAKDNHLFEKEEVKFEVYYGETEDEKVFCEVFYRTDNALQFTENELVQSKTYPEASYLHTTSTHHFLESNSRSIWRYIEQNEDLSFSDSDEPYFRPYFEEYRLKNNTLNMYTPLDIYICIKENE